MLDNKSNVCALQLDLSKISEEHASVQNKADSMHYRILQAMDQSAMHLFMMRPDAALNTALEFAERQHEQTLDDDGLLSTLPSFDRPGQVSICICCPSQSICTEYKTVLCLCRLSAHHCNIVGAAR